MKKTLILATAAAALFVPQTRTAADDVVYVRSLERELRLLRTSLKETNQHVRALQLEIAALNATVAQLTTQVGLLRGGVPAAVTPIRPKPAPAGRHELVIRVSKDNWGQSGIKDMEKVCHSAAGELWQHFSGRRLSTIVIRRSTSGPITLYQRGPDGEYIVRLDSADRHWAQLAYQFAHEFCHILTNYGEKASRKNHWFAESLCEMASIYALRRMAVTWKTKPPYPNWKSYAPSLETYAEKNLKNKDRQLPANTTLAQWYKANEAELRKSGYSRDRNAVAAYQMLPLFEADPAGWEAVGYLNIAKLDADESFSGYMTGWYDSAPTRHKPFVKKIMKLFGLD